MSLDKCKVLSGEDIVINDKITLRQPTIREIINEDSQKFLSTFYRFCSIPSDLKSVLWDAGIDWNKMSDWELFINISRSFSKEDTHLIFGDNIDFSKMGLATIDDNENEVVLYDEEQELIIDEKTYLEFIDYVREMVGCTLKREKARNKATRLAMIEEDRINRLHPKQTNDDPFIYSAIITLVNTEEFPYTYESVKDITIYQLMKSFYQIPKKKSALALYQGSMSGFVDTSKIDKNNFQWIYTNDKKS